MEPGHVHPPLLQEVRAQFQVGHGDVGAVREEMIGRAGPQVSQAVAALEHGVGHLSMQMLGGLLHVAEQDGAHDQRSQRVAYGHAPAARGQDGEGLPGQVPGRDEVALAQGDLGQARGQDRAPRGHGPLLRLGHEGLTGRTCLGVALGVEKDQERGLQDVEGGVRRSGGLQQVSGGGDGLLSRAAREQSGQLRARPGADTGQGSTGSGPGVGGRRAEDQGSQRRERAHEQLVLRPDLGLQGPRALARGTLHHPGDLVHTAAPGEQVHQSEGVPYGQQAAPVGVHQVLEVLGGGHRVDPPLGACQHGDDPGPERLVGAEIQRQVQTRDDVVDLVVGQVGLGGVQQQLDRPGVGAAVAEQGGDRLVPVVLTRCEVHGVDGAHHQGAVPLRGQGTEDGGTGGAEPERTVRAQDADLLQRAQGLLDVPGTDVEHAFEEQRGGGPQSTGGLQDRRGLGDLHRRPIAPS